MVEKVRGEVEEMIEERGAEAAYGVGISDLHPKLARLVGRLRFRTHHGQNLLQHCLETAIIAGHMAEVIGASSDVAVRAGLLHEIGQSESDLASHPILLAADLANKYGESEDVAQAIRGSPRR